MPSPGERTSADWLARRSRVLDVLPEAVLLLDGDLKLVEHNGVAHRWLGLEPSADLNSAAHPDDLAMLLASENEVRQAGPGWNAPVPVRMRHADGSWHTWSVSATNRLADPEVRAIVVVARDVSGRSFADAVHADAVLRELVTIAPIALVALDREGRVRYASGAGMVIEPGTIIGRRFDELSESEQQRDMIARALRGERVDEVSVWDDRWWQVRYSPLTTEGEVDGTVAAFTDVTDRALAERALAASEAHLRGVLESVREALVVVDEQGCITSSNERFRSLFGPGAAAGNYLRDALDETTADLLEEVLAGSDRTSERTELRLYSHTGAPVWVLASASRLRADDGTPVGSVVVLTDITRNKDVERRLAAVARTDPVTGTGSRATLADRLDTALARRDGLVAVLFCDVDGLKPVNDRHGHHAGDTLLRAVADRIRSALRPADTLVRYGGDEFVVVCDGLPDAAEAVDLAERVRAAVAVPLRLDDGTELTPTVSVGVATAPPLHGPADLLAAADRAVYAAKSAGRDAVRVAQ